jgi:hypothetical protein
MKGDPVPEEHHIARLCQTKQISHDGEILAPAFMLRTREQTLSVNWLEFLNRPDRQSEIDQIQNIYTEKNLKIGAGYKIAVLNVRIVRRKVLEGAPDARNINVLHDPEYTPEYNDASHSVVDNLRHGDLFIAELIAQTILSTYPARRERH